MNHAPSEFPPRRAAWSGWRRSFLRREDRYSPPHVELPCVASACRRAAEGYPQRAEEPLLARAAAPDQKPASAELEEGCRPRCRLKPIASRELCPQLKQW